MSTLQFAKIASSVKTQVIPEDPNIFKKDRYKEMMSEIKFLKQVLKIKSSPGGVSELVYKIKELEGENKKLRNLKATNQRIKQIIQENRALKMKIRKTDSPNDTLNQFSDTDGITSINAKPSEIGSRHDIEEDQITINKFNSSKE